MTNDKLDEIKANITVKAKNAEDNKVLIFEFNQITDQYDIRFIKKC